MAQTVVLSATLPTEASTSPGVVTPLFIVVTPVASVIDSALNVNALQPLTVIVTIPSEISTSPGALTYGRSITAGLPTTAATIPGALTHSKAVALGLPVEFDFPIGFPKTIKPSLPFESSSVPGALTGVKVRVVGLVSEVSSIPLPFNVVSFVQLGLPTEVSVATGLPERANGSVTLKVSLAATGHVNKYHANGSVTLTASIVSAASVIPTWSAGVNLPAMVVAGDMIVGGSYAANVTLPAMTGDGSANSGAAVTMPMLVATGIMFQGKSIDGTIDMPALRTAGTMDVPAIASADLTIPTLRVTGEMITGAVMTGSPTLQIMAVTGGMTVPEVHTGAVTLPAVVVKGTLAVSAVASGDMTFPVVNSVGEMSNSVAITAQGFTLNTKLLLHTKYSSFPFTAFGQLGTSVYGADSSGLYKLSGTSDNGVNISATFMSGADDYDSAKLKAQNVVYLGYETDGTVEVLIGTDGSSTFDNVYPVNRDMSASNLRPARVEIGRGLRSRYWRTGVRNVAGSFFKVYELGHGVSKLKRKS